MILENIPSNFNDGLNDPRERSRDHWTAGAAVLAAFSSQFGLIPALAVAGHHCGLQQIVGKAEDFYHNLGDDIKKDAKNEKYTESDLKLLVNRFLTDDFSLPKLNKGLRLRHFYAADMLDARMFFSSLVDADYLETEAHFQGDASTPRRPRLMDLRLMPPWLSRLWMRIFPKCGGKTALHQWFPCAKN